ncbi:MAG TPA: hypothetical protein H9684_11865 [Firmicutes bacterium]|nr:hypothetical protein [Bacillota bacterium]
MIKRITCGLLSLLLIAGLLSSCAADAGVNTIEEGEVILPNTAGNDVNGTTYETVAENESLALLINRDTTSFQVLNKRDGQVYQAVPTNASSASDRSLLELTYLDSQGISATMNSFNDSVSKGQFTIESVDNGVKIRFTLGNVQEDLFVPPAFSVERFEELTGKIEGTFDRTWFRSQYYLADLDAISDESAKTELRSRYPALKDGPMYVLRQTVLSLSVQRDIHRILVETGYTEEDYAQDMENGGELEQSQYPVFDVSMYVTLDGDRLNVRVPVEEIQEFNGGTMLELTVLKTFASPDPEEPGRFLLPDGAGSLMNFYNGKENQQLFAVPVYGRDLSVQQEEQIYKENVAYLPLYGKIFDGRGAVLTTITDGDALAEIRAFPGSADGYAAAYPVFQVREVARSYLSSSSREQGDYFSITQEYLYDGDLALQMRFFDKDHTALRDLAASYADDLFEGADADAGAAPLVLEFIGVAQQHVGVMGISMEQATVYTTLQDVLAIGKELKAAGVDRMVVKLTGFFKGGLSQPFASGLKLASGVGSQADLDELKAWAEDNQVTLYMDVDVQYAYTNSLFDGLFLGEHLSKRLTKETALDRRYNMATYQVDTTDDYVRYILNPGAVDEAVKGAVSILEELGMNGVSLRYVGTDANADYKESRMVERQTAMNRLMENVRTVAADRMVSTIGANAPVLPFVRDVMEVSMKGYQYDICDETVPFLQMVLGGHVRYADEPRNLSGNTDDTLLDTLRTGGGLAFTLTANEEETFQKTDYPQYYSTKYSFWMDTILEQYRQMDSIAADTASGIVDDQKLAENLYQTTYGNGSVMLTNYSDESRQALGQTIEPKGFVVVKGGAQSNG